MTYEVIVLHLFNRQAKRLLKKYPSLKKELAGLITSLAENPKQGVSLGNSCFKIRLSIASKGRGKSGEARLITHVHFSENIIFLMDLYDKAEQNNTSVIAITQQLKSIYNS